MAGFMVNPDIGPSNREYPFGALLATSSRATTPLPPGRLSMMICWPNCSVSLAPSIRAWKSAEPPGGNETTSRSGRLG